MPKTALRKSIEKVPLDLEVIEKRVKDGRFSRLAIPTIKALVVQVRVLREVADHRVTDLEAEVARLKKSNDDMSWKLYPDRMGS